MKEMSIGSNTMGFDVLVYKSPHCSKRLPESVIKAVILHCIGIPEIRDVFSTFDHYKVSAHYFVPQISAAELLHIIPDAFVGQSLQFPNQAPVILMVDEEMKAYHAGISKFGQLNLLPGCDRSLNECSIGIEFHSPGYANGDGSDLYVFGSFTDAQKETGIKLIQYLLDKHRIDPCNVFAHSTIAVGRKTDPGPTFFWDDLHSLGIARTPALHSPSENTSDMEFVQTRLQEIGFISNDQSACIDAFIMQYAPHLWPHKNNEITEKLISELKWYIYQLH